MSNTNAEQLKETLLFLAGISVVAFVGFVSLSLAYKEYRFRKAVCESLGGSYNHITCILESL